MRSVLRQLLPGTCLMCDLPIPPRPGPDLCRFCIAALPWNGSACPRCAEPAAAAEPAVGRAAGFASAPGVDCAACRRRPPPFALALAPLRYEGFPQMWVTVLKDQLGMVEGRTLGMLLADAADARYCAAAGPRRPDLLVPVPLTARRLARRGHNQALTLAAPVAARLRVPVLRRAVVRLHQPRRQRGLSRAERLGNLAGSFVCRRRWTDPGPCVGIVDDVLTTGATAAELARVLLAAGAAEVHVLCATRAVRLFGGAGTDSALLSR